MKNLPKYLEQRAFFLGCHPGQELDGADKVILGLPMDSTTSFRPGTRLAPYRIREVSEEIEEYSVYQDCSLADCRYIDVGDVTIPWGNIDESLARIESTARYLIGLKKMIYGIGGEHLVSLPLIKACYNYYPDLVVLQMDAHADLRQDYLEQELSHATVMRRVAEMLGEGRVYQLGIRSATREEIDFARHFTRLYLDRFLQVIPDIAESIGSRPVYVSLDIDVLDPAYAPGTGTPEGGGISSKEVLEALHRLKVLNVVGFDIVEVSPPFDIGDNTSMLAAKILREALLAF